MSIKTTVAIAILLPAVHAAPLTARAGEIEIPPEVTPAMRAACEADVRRLCITPTSTVATVRQCVLAKYLRLGRKCQIEIASAGLAP